MRDQSNQDKDADSKQLSKLNMLTFYSLICI